MVRTKFKDNVSLTEAVKFHGHLGPYLVLGLLAGKCALKKIKAKKYFGVEVKVWGAKEKPKSCFIDGLQLSTGATYGKGNIQKLNGNLIKLRVRNCSNNKKAKLTFTKNLINKLNGARTHKESEALALKLIKTNFAQLFNLVLNS